MILRRNVERNQASNAWSFGNICVGPDVSNSQNQEKHQIKVSEKEFVLLLNVGISCPIYLTCASKSLKFDD